MDTQTLGAAIAIAKSIPDTAIGSANSAASRAEQAAKTVEESVGAIQSYQNTGLTMVNGRLCVKVERS